MKSCDRALILIAALITAGFGVWLLINPMALAGVGIPADSPIARVEIRAMYGGLELGIAAFLLWCAAVPAWRRVGLVAAALMVGGIALGRGLGILLEGGAEPLMWFFFAIEAVYTACAVACLKRPATP